MKFTGLAIFALINNTSAIKVEEAREPLLTWAPKVPASHPVNYPVPDFGVDNEIISSQNHEQVASK